METLETIKLDLQQRLAYYRQRTDAKSHVIKKLEEQIKVLENCVDLNDSKVNNQLLILLRNTIYKAMYVENPADVLIVGIRLSNNPEIRHIDLADMVYSNKLDDGQPDLYRLLEIGRCDWEAIALGTCRQAPSNKYLFHMILENIDNYKV